MQVLDTKESWSRVVKGEVLVIGNFDGFHLGHQSLLSRARQMADQKGVGLCIMTFDPHPVAILKPERSPGMLTPLDLKLHLLEKSGVDWVVVVRDSFELLNLAPEHFVDRFLMGQLKPCAIVEGPNFTFGFGRSGNIDILKVMGKERGVDVEVIEPMRLNIRSRGEVMVSSSLIRQLLENGFVADAAKCLGRVYKLIGRTIKGRGIGTELGFPTANIESVRQVIPAEGVYAGYVTVGDSIVDVYGQRDTLPAAISIGRAKTFMSDHPQLLEAHILSENVGALYDKWMAFEFVEYIRPQKRFETVDKLKEQIGADCKAIAEILKSK